MKNDKPGRATTLDKIVGESPSEEVTFGLILK